MSKFSEDLTGQVFSALTVLEPTRNAQKQKAWKVQCQCGEFRILTGTVLKTGKCKSCGCLRGKRLSDSVKTHGLSKTPIFYIWKQMWQRCTKTYSEKYKDYGAKGITVDERWKDILVFIKDMGPRPEGYQLERSDNKKGYSKENCVWATRTQNVRNRSNTVFVEYQGNKIPLAEAAELSGIQYATLYSRRNKGWKDIFKNHANY